MPGNESDLLHLQSPNALYTHTRNRSCPEQPSQTSALQEKHSSLQQKLLYPPGQQRPQCYSNSIKLKHILKLTCTKTPWAICNRLYKEPDLLIRLVLWIPKRQLDFQSESLFKICKYQRHTLGYQKCLYNLLLYNNNFSGRCFPVFLYLKLRQTSRIGHHDYYDHCNPYYGARYVKMNKQVTEVLARPFLVPGPKCCVLCHCCPLLPGKMCTLSAWSNSPA